MKARWTPAHRSLSMNNLRRILAISLITVRNAARTRVFTSLLVLVVLATCVFPLIVKGDGTIQGYAQIALDYSLTLLAFILAAATVWAAAGVSSHEIEEKQIHLLVTKPVSAFHIWMGKWIGLLVMNASLLLLAGICVSATLRWHLRPSVLTSAQRQMVSDEVLTARRVISPEGPQREQKINKRPEESMAPANHDNDAIESLNDEAVPTIAQEDNTIQPGASRVWRFGPGDRLSDSLPVSLRFQMSSPRQLELKPVAVEWHIYSSAGSVRRTLSADVYAGQPNSFTFRYPGGHGTIVAEFVNVQTNPPATVHFKRNGGVLLMIPQGSFEINLAKAMIMLFCRLAILCALGLTMGSFFSMPVAVFVSFAAIAGFSLSGMSITSGTTQGAGHIHSAHEQNTPGTSHTVEFRSVDALFAPIRRYDPIESLQRSELIPWSLVAEAFAVEVLLYSGVFCLAGVIVLRRREFGIPSA